MDMACVLGSVIDSCVMVERREPDMERVRVRERGAGLRRRD